MCGRYALAMRPAEVRRHLQESHMPSQEDSDDDRVRQTHNFAPGYYGLVYRADVPDYGAGPVPHQDPDVTKHDAPSHNLGKSSQGKRIEELEEYHPPKKSSEAQYKLQAMKWGLVPFWTKRNPDYGSMMKTINCRDDSLMSSGGMWNTMKQRKRCLVVAQGFYEWLKKSGSKDKKPHYVKRKDGQLMCFAGLWDCVKFENTEEKLYTYTIITTDSNKQLGFLHDRMPVILDNGSDDMFSWLDSKKSEWCEGLQSLLKPFKGELECYPVVTDVGRVGNDSPTFIVPVDSTENKQNISNFFNNQKKASTTTAAKEETAAVDENVQTQGNHDPSEAPTTKYDTPNSRENNAPKPAAGTKHSLEIQDDDDPEYSATPTGKHQKTTTTPQSSPGKKSNSQTRSATSNTPKPKKSSSKSAGDGSKKITSFFSI